jgi:hypothetical protein
MASFRGGHARMLLYMCCVLCLVQVGAGHSYQLLPHVFTWQGLSGKFEGFGTSITPLNDDDTLVSA